MNPLKLARGVWLLSKQGGGDIGIKPKRVNEGDVHSSGNATYEIRGGKGSGEGPRGISAFGGRDA